MTNLEMFAIRQALKNINIFFQSEGYNAAYTLEASGRVRLSFNFETADMFGDLFESPEFYYTPSIVESESSVYPVEIFFTRVDAPQRTFSVGGFNETFMDVSNEVYDSLNKCRAEVK